MLSFQSTGHHNAEVQHSLPMNVLPNSGRCLFCGKCHLLFSFPVFCNWLCVTIDQGTRCEEYDCVVPYSKGVQCSEDHLKYETASFREKTEKKKKLRKRKNREKENQPPLRCQAQPASLRKNLWPIRWSWFCHRTERKTTTLSIFWVHSNIQISGLAQMTYCQVVKLNIARIVNTASCHNQA